MVYGSVLWCGCRHLEQSDDNKDKARLKNIFYYRKMVIRNMNKEIIDYDKIVTCTYVGCKERMRYGNSYVCCFCSRCNSILCVYHRKEHCISELKNINK